MNTAKNFAELFDSVTDIVDIAGGTEQVVFVAVSRDWLPALIQGVEPTSVHLEHHGTPGIYELVVASEDRTIEPAPRP